MIRIFALCCMVLLVGCAGLSPAPLPEPDPEPPRDPYAGLVAVAKAAIAMADPEDLEPAPTVLLVQDPPIEDSWPEGVQKVWQARWLDPNPQETEEDRWLMLCPLTGGEWDECYPMGLVSRTLGPDPRDVTQDTWIYSGWVHLPEQTSPFPSKALLMSQDVGQATDSPLSNEALITGRVHFITPATPVPEPTMVAAMPAGLLLLAWLARKRLRRT